MYIYLNKDWPNFFWNNDLIIPLLTNARKAQGILLGKISNLGFDVKLNSSLESLSAELVDSNLIEGEVVDFQTVRSSIAKKIGINIESSKKPTKNINDLVNIIYDATENYSQELTIKRLFTWHKYLNLDIENSGNWRNDSKGPMQVISGLVGNEKIHFQAPEAKLIDHEMRLFLDYANNSNAEALIKAAIIHLWFVTIHPFDDGNGRLARLLTEMYLTRSDYSKQRFYNLSSEILKDRKNYYNVLELTQNGDLDITIWLEWFLKSLERAIDNSINKIDKTLEISYFWTKNQNIDFNFRQKKIINLLLQNFEGNLTSSKWAKLNKCSQDTALRDIDDLIIKKILIKSSELGRNTNYKLV